MAHRILDTELPRGYPLVTVCRRYHIFHGGLGRGSKELIHTYGSICRLLKLTDKLGQISFCGVWSNSRRELAMREGLGNADGEFSHAIPLKNDRLTRSK